MYLLNEKPATREPVRPPFNIKPPIVSIAFLAVGLGLHFAFPARVLPGQWLQFAIGVPVIVLGIVIDIFASRLFTEAHTDASFADPAAKLVREGIYNRSRNPMYVAGMLIFLGIFLTVNAARALIVLPFAFAYIRFGLIAREEISLELQFGDEYRSYKARVRRWI